MGAGLTSLLWLAGLLAMAVLPATPAGAQLIVPGFEPRPFQDCPTCPVMLALPNGLEISRAPVTRAEFVAFVTATGYERQGWGCHWLYTHIEQGDDHPVVCVTFQGAQAYADWLARETGKAYRLPTVEEMRYAALGNQSGNYWWGQAIGRERANCISCGSTFDGVGTSPVGAFKPNPFGILDPVGNVWIWTKDCRTEDCAERLLIGGSWSSPPGDLRVTKTIWNGVDVPFNTYGFRVVRSEE